MSLMPFSLWEVPSLREGWPWQKSIQADISNHTSLVCSIPLTPSRVLSRIYSPTFPSKEANCFHLTLSPSTLPLCIFFTNLLLHILSTRSNYFKIFYLIHSVTPHPMSFSFSNIPRLDKSLLLIPSHLIAPQSQP